MIPAEEIEMDFIIILGDFFCTFGAKLYNSDLTIKLKQGTIMFFLVLKQTIVYFSQ